MQIVIRVLLVIAVLLVAVVVVCCVRAARLKPSRPQGSPLDAHGYEAGDDAVERFQALLRIPTVSRDDPSKVDRAAFERWIPTLERLYPRAWGALELTRIDEFGILVRWPGRDQEADPVVLMAHQDVVPTEGQDWRYPPFEAQVHDGQIWARGTLDTKCIVAAFFESVDHLVGQGFVPPRDVWYFSSNGEEVNAPTCADAVAWLHDHDISPYLVLDEGGAVAGDVPLGVKVPVAMVGVSEKGHVDLTVTARADGGHASTPSRNDACRLLSRACERITANPGKPEFVPAVEATLTELASRSSFLYRVIFSNLWLFRPVVAKIMCAGPETAAMLRSTYALTQMAGSTARNVLPPQATADLNVRVAPFEGLDDVLARARALADEEATSSGVPGHVTVERDETSGPLEPAPVSPFEDDAAFDYIHRCVAGVYPEAGFAPYVQSSSSDSYEFGAICERVYRFAGFIYSGEARGLIHGANERIGVDVFKRGIGFYMAFLSNLDQLGA